MKKLRLVFAMAGIAAVSLVSCSKDCQTCVDCGNNIPDVEVCKDDAQFGGNDNLYDAAIIGYEANGCDCD